MAVKYCSIGVNLLLDKVKLRLFDFLSLTIISHFTNVIVINNCNSVTFVKFICFTKLKFVSL